MTDHITKVREALEAFDRTSAACVGHYGPLMTTALMRRARAYQDLTHAATDAARSLLAALDEAQKDARRYRWLVDMDMLSQPSVDMAKAFERLTGSALDAAIDAAIAAQEGGKDA